MLFFTNTPPSSWQGSAKFPPLKSCLVGWVGGGGLFDNSVKPGPHLSRSRLVLVRLLTRKAKAMFSQVGYQVSQVGQGQGQELDNIAHPWKYLLNNRCF